MVSILLESGASALLVNGALVYELAAGDQGIGPGALGEELAAALGVEHQFIQFDADSAQTDWQQIYADAIALGEDTKLLLELGFRFKPVDAGHTLWRAYEPAGRWPHPELDEARSLTGAERQAIDCVATYARQFHDISPMFWSTLERKARHDLIREAYTQAEMA